MHSVQCIKDVNTKFVDCSQEVKSSRILLSEVLVGLGPPPASLQVAGVHGQRLVAVVDGRVGAINFQVALCTVAVKEDGRKCIKPWDNV